jgi:hypothetical protein
MSSGVNGEIHSVSKGALLIFGGGAPHNLLVKKIVPFV